MGNITITRAITLKEKDSKLFDEFCEKEDISFSQLLRKGAKCYIEVSNNG